MTNYVQLVQQFKLIFASCVEAKCGHLIS